MSRQYTEQEIRAFYKQIHEKSSDGCYNIHVPTWDAMVRQNPNLCVDLEVEYLMSKFNKEFPEERSI